MIEAIVEVLRLGWYRAFRFPNRSLAAYRASLRQLSTLVVAAIVLSIGTCQRATAQTARTLSGENSASVVDTVTVPLHLSLEQAIEEALARNPGLLAQGERVESASRSAAAAFREHFGEIDAVAWGSRYQDDQILRPISSQLLAGGFESLPFDRDQLHYGLTFELPLFVGGKLQAGVKLARLKADEARALLDGTRWQVRANVTSIYAANQAVDRAIDAFEAQVTTLETTEKKLKLMVDSGKKPEVDLLKVAETLEEARAELASAYADQAHAEAALAAILNRPVDQSFELDPLPSEFPRPPGGDLNWSDLLATSSTCRTADLRVEQSESGKNIVRSEFLPKLSFRGYFLGNRGPSIVGAEKTWELALGVSWPLFTGGRRIASYQGAIAEQRAAEQARIQTQRQLEADLRSSLARFTANESELTAAMKRVDASGAAAHIEQLRYETGAGTIEDLLRAQTHAASAMAALARAQGNVLVTAARINAIVENEVIR